MTKQELRSLIETLFNSDTTYLIPPGVDSTTWYVDSIMGLVTTYCTRQEAVERYLVATSMLLYVGPLVAQASQSKENFPPQTHECIQAAYEELISVLAENRWAMGNPEKEASSDLL